jgi:alpha-mannosidase
MVARRSTIGRPPAARVAWAVVARILVLATVIALAHPPHAASPLHAAGAGGQNVSDSLWGGDQRPLVSGCIRPQDGERLQHYESAHRDSTVALVSRATKGEHIATCESAKIPFEMTRGLTLAFLLSVDVDEDVHTWQLEVGPKTRFQLQSPASESQREIALTASNGAELIVDLFHRDRNGDLSGHGLLRLPAGAYRPGAPVTLRLVGESGASDRWLMLFPYDVRPHARVRQLPSIIRRLDGTRQELRVEVAHFGRSKTVTVNVGEASLRQRVPRGYSEIRLQVPEAKTETMLPVRVDVENTAVLDEALPMAPVRRMTVYLLHHSHLDIGYTHRQRKVEEIQVENLRRATRLAARSTDASPDSRFHWVQEGIWPIEAFLSRASPQEREQFEAAVRSGLIEIPALYANQLTGLANGEELLEMTAAAKRLTSSLEVPLDTAWISDVPGYTWGMVPTLASRGVKYFSMGTNRGDRIGNIIEALGDRPFYWESPSGEDRVLAWVHLAGYSLFHTGLHYREGTRLDERRLLDYIDRLTRRDFPYDLTLLRYNIGSDNGPPDETLSSAVYNWNAIHETPRLVIATPSQAFEAFEAKYGTSLPVRRGELTPYWEDGAYSTAAETVTNLASSARLVQAATADAIRCGAKPCGGSSAPEASRPADDVDFTSAWRNVLLYNEHTWGAWNSISQPDEPFVHEQWAAKRAFAEAADAQSRALLHQALGGTDLSADEGGTQATNGSDGQPAAPPASAGAPPGASVMTIDVYNTLSWPRTELVLLPASLLVPNDLIIDDDGQKVPSQRLASGELAFLAENVPGLGVSRYRTGQAAATAQEDEETDDRAGAARAATQRLQVNPAVTTVVGDASAHGIYNGAVSVDVDPGSGTIRRLRVQGADGNWVDHSRWPGLNTYVYQEGRKPGDSNSRIPEAAPRIVVEDAGPLVWTLVVSSDQVPGASALQQRIRLVRDQPRVSITNKIVKLDVRRPESVYFAFPFNLSGGTTRVGTAWGHYEVGKEQIPGSSMNYLTARDWVDVSSQDRGVTLVTPDALMVQVGEIATDANAAGWKSSLESSPLLYSWVMNNFWTTNYKASQSGAVSFRYAIVPHGAFESAAAYRAAAEARHPLLVTSVNPKSPKPAPLVTVRSKMEGSKGGTTDSALVVTSVRRAQNGGSLRVRFFNAGTAPVRPSLDWRRSPRAVTVVNANGERVKGKRPGDVVPSQGMLTLDVVGTL